MRCDLCEAEDIVVTELTITEPIERAYGYGPEETVIHMGQVTLFVKADGCRKFCKKCLCELTRRIIDDLERGLKTNIIGVPLDE